MKKTIQSTALAGLLAFSLNSSAQVSGDVDVIGTQTVFDAFYGVPVLDGDRTWTKDNVYVLTDRLYVKEETTLTIEPGTRIYGTFDDGGTPGVFDDDEVGAIIVARGGRLIAAGTPSEPIVFDAIQTLEAQRGVDLPYDPDTVAGPMPTAETGGLWGGVILLGNAYIAFAESGTGINIGNNQIEGFVPATANDNDGDGRDDILEYGFDAAFARDDDDSSGIVRYVSIRHGGYQVGTGNEINGLTLGGVGRDTVIEYVEVVSNQDDGIEFFGGTVNTKNIALVFNQDDSFDIDEGHTGVHQFWFAVQNPNSADNGGEWDGVTGNTGSTDPSITRSHPLIYNATFVGPGAGSGISGSDKGNNAFLIDDSFAGEIYNSVFHDFAEDFVEVTTDGLVGTILAANNTIGDFGGYDGASNTSALTAPAAFLTTNPFFSALGVAQNGHSNVGTDPGFSFYLRDGSSNLAGLDPRPAGGSALLASNGAALSGGAPKPADYRGAFGPGAGDQWLDSWSWYAAQGYITGVAPGESVFITAIGQVDADTIFIQFVSTVPNTLHAVRSSTDLMASPFTGAVTISDGSLTTDGSGVGLVEIDITSSPLFFQIQLP